MNTLEDLSKRHNDWLKMATKICKSNVLAKDLVQDMYLKIGCSDISIKKEYSNFIYTVMSNIHKNQIKKDFQYNENNETVKVVLSNIDDYKDRM